MTNEEGDAIVQLNMNMSIILNKFIGKIFINKNLFFDTRKKYSIVLSTEDYNKYHIINIYKLMKVYLPNISIYATNFIKNSPEIRER
jgi:hypothetical protein